VKSLVPRAAIAALCALSLAGCIDSSDPILSDSKAVFGPRLNLQFYSLSKDVAKEPSHETFAWNGALYVRSGGARTIDTFSVFEFENDDYIVQSATAKLPRKTEYALLHKLAEGVYLARVIDEEDADEQTRAALCMKSDKYGCRIETPDQLFAFARATAARQHTSGGLVIRLPDGSDKSERAGRRHR
jgi:hypothetical protein